MMPGDRELIRLPAEALDRLRRPLARFLGIEAATGAVLMAATALALLLSNSPWAHHYQEAWETQIGIEVGSWEYLRSAREWINDGLMTLFFFLVSLELKREIVLGELRHPRTAALSIAAAVGGMVVPAMLYLALQSGLPGQHGWGTVMATDTAFVIGCLALLGRRIPQSLRVFMLSLAIVDDIGAILVVAIGYSGDISWYALALAVLGIVAIRAMGAVGFRSFPPYVLLGTLVWISVDASGLHATVTGVVLGLMTPARRWVSDDRMYAILRQAIAHPSSDQGSGHTRDRETLQAAEIAAREALAPVERLELALHPWVGFLVMPLFALANAGVPLSVGNLLGPVTLAILLGFTVGKPLGILSFTWLAVRAGIALRPPMLTWGAIAGGSLLAGIGFTMALFIASIAFGESVLGNAKLSILLSSVISALAGLAVLTWATSERPQP
jgi:NhaA family Na+:H+ antiporter